MGADSSGFARTRGKESLGKHRSLSADSVENRRRGPPGISKSVQVSEEGSIPPVAGSALVGLDLLAGGQVKPGAEERLKNALISWGWI
jgi:hypothetical protein